MKKSEALQLLGGTNAAVARALGISSSAVSQWPEDAEGDLPRATEDRVLAELWRREQAAKVSTKEAA
jgi:DNA-binding transcriptional regulator YdaS (Cro superfamily)